MSISALIPGLSCFWLMSCERQLFGDVRLEAVIPLTASFARSASRPSTSSSAAIAYPESSHPFSSLGRGLIQDSGFE